MGTPWHNEAANTLLFYPHQGQAKLALLPPHVNNQDYARLPVSFQLISLVTKFATLVVPLADLGSLATLCHSGRHL